ncbi:hypothetical protein [Gaopeijia maritima]|uniref:hypothetical protein n=1 Tax=Gaopeijia maritima TaxID=3119007 RepID=UPI003285290F
MGKDSATREGGCNLETAPSRFIVISDREAFEVPMAQDGFVISLESDGKVLQISMENFGSGFHETVGCLHLAANRLPNALVEAIHVEHGDLAVEGPRHEAARLDATAAGSEVAFLKEEPRKLCQETLR